MSPGALDVERAERAHRAEVAGLRAELAEAHEQLDRLQAAREHAVDLYDLAPVACLTLDPAGVVQEVNLTGASLLGLPRGRLVGTPLAAVVRFAEPARFWDHLARCTRTAAPVTSELRFTRRGGGIFDAQIVTVPVLDAGGRSVAFRTVLTEIGARRAAEAEVERARAEEARLRHRFETLDRVGLALNQALAGLGRTPTEAVLQVVVEQARLATGAEYAALGIAAGPGHPFSPWIHSGLTPERVQAIGRAPRAAGLLGEVATSGHPLRLRDAREHPAFRGFPEHHPVVGSFLGVPIRFAGRSVGTLYLGNKRTAPEFSEEDLVLCELLAIRIGPVLEVVRLREREARERTRLDVLARTAPALLGSFDRAAVLHALARLAVPWLADLAVVHVLEEEALRPAGVAVDPRSVEDAGAVLEAPPIARDAAGVLAEAWRTRRAVLAADLDPAGLEAAFPGVGERHAARRLGIHSLLVVPLEAHDAVLGVMTLAYTRQGRRYDDGDLREAHELATRASLALESCRLYAEARTAVQARDDILALVAHDLRGPLSAITLSCEVMRRSAPRGERRRDRAHIDVVQRAAQRARRLIDDLVTAASLDAGVFQVEPHPDEIAAVVAEALESLSPLAALKQVRLEPDVPSGLPLVLADRGRLVQVVVNLVGNAIKAVPERGRVRLDALAVDGEVRLLVTDDGPGIPERQLPPLRAIPERHVAARPPGDRARPLHRAQDRGGARRPHLGGAARRGRQPVRLQRAPGARQRARA